MFCTNCGKKIDDTTKFCIHCGTPTSNQQANTSVTEIGPTDNQAIIDEVKAKPKKVNKLIPIIIGATLLIIIAVGVTGYFLYQRHLEKQTDNVMAYLDDREYEEALDLYEKYSGKKAALDDKVFAELVKSTEQIKSDYMSENIDYYSAIDQLHSLEDFNITDIDLIIYDTTQWINRINTSRENYQEGMVYYELGNYDAALEKYGLVLSEDRKYYELAVDEINLILQEEVDRQREAEEQEADRINEIRKLALAKAEGLAMEYSYQAAINAIENGLVQIPNDPELEEYLSLYTELYKLAINVPAFDTTLYEYTYTEQGIDIMTVTMEMPVLVGESLGYKSINQIFENTKEYYINENNLMVEEAKLIVNEEYFIPYSFGITYSVQYNNNGILCIMLDGYIYTGGAHGYPIRNALVFDLASGTPRSLSSLISTDDKTFASYVTDEFQRMYYKAPDEYWPDSLDVVTNDSINIDDLNYYINEDHICIYYFPYDLASYARGFVDIIIPYEGNEWMFEYLN